MLLEQEERLISNMKVQREITEKTIDDELRRQKESWSNYVKGRVLCLFYADELKTGFFAYRNELRKRTNLSFEEQIFMKAPDNIELRMPVAIRKRNGKITLYDLNGSMPVEVNKEQESDLSEESLYIMHLTKHYPMYPLKATLNEPANGVDLRLTPATLPLQVSLKNTDFELFETLSPQSIEEAVKSINLLQNYYRLKDYEVERINEITIAVQTKDEDFLISFDIDKKKLMVGTIQ